MNEQTPDSRSYTWAVNQSDVSILRELLKRKREIAQDPIMETRRQLWTQHASLNSQRPMILAEVGGVLDEVVPLATLQCQAAWAREMERGLRALIFNYEYVGDDTVVEPWIPYGWHVTIGDFGVKPAFVHGSNEGKLGSYTWEPPIKDLDADFDLLHVRELSVKREKTEAWRSFVEDLFGDILPVRLRANYWWTTGLTWTAIDLIGLEPLMMAMYDNPEGLHRLMAFLRDDFMHMLDWFEDEGLLSLNNENDYVGSGTQGYTDELPQPDWQAGDPVRIKDLWGLCESQETVGISPSMFEEFIFPYQLPIIRRFGLSYYGCCEPIHNRWHMIQRIPNLRRVSISPWCDQEKMAKALGQDYIFCRKPNPTLISTEHFNEAMIREDLHETLRVAGQGPLELVMKDVHTLCNQPLRLGRWVTLAREVCAEYKSFDTPMACRPERT
jgi:hypothetical protein